MKILKKLSEHLDTELPLVVYKKPNCNQIKGLFQKNTTLYTSNNFAETGFIFAPFDTSKKAIIIPTDYASSSSEILNFSSVNHQTKIITSDKNSDTQEFHTKIITKAIEQIKNGLFTKVVLSRKEVITLATVDIISIFKKLTLTYDSSFVYLWFHPKVGLWMGATPETLLKVDDKSFETMSLAGTQEYQKDKHIQWKQKEIDEQKVVTDYILSKIHSLNLITNTSDVTTVKAGSLLHLCTKITGEASNNNQQVIQALHPTPAVCGFPTNIAKEFILQTENYDREFYTGFLGELNTGKERNLTDLFVNLRCMKIIDNKAHLYIGGGINKDSNPIKEWEETVAKSKIMKTVLSS